MEMGKVLGAQSYTKNYRLLKVLRTKENSPPEKSTPIGYPPKRSVLKTYVYKKNTDWTDCICASRNICLSNIHLTNYLSIYLYVCVYLCIYTSTELSFYLKERNGVHGKIWRDESGSDLVIISKNLFQKLLRKSSRRKE